MCLRMNEVHFRIAYIWFLESSGLIEDSTMISCNS